MLSCAERRCSGSAVPVGMPRQGTNLNRNGVLQQQQCIAAAAAATAATAARVSAWRGGNKDGIDA